MNTAGRHRRTSATLGRSPGLPTRTHGPTSCSRNRPRSVFLDAPGTNWDLHDRGKAAELREAYAAFLLMRNLDEQIPGANLYLFKKRGIFKTAVTRTAAPTPGVAPRVTNITLPPDAIAEIEYRFAGLQRWLRP